MLCLISEDLAVVVDKEYHISPWQSQAACETCARNADDFVSPCLDVTHEKLEQIVRVHAWH